MFEGIEELFRFRLKKKKKDKIRKQFLIKNSLFPEIQWKMLGMDI